MKTIAKICLVLAAGSLVMILYFGRKFFAVLPEPNFNAAYALIFFGLFGAFVGTSCYIDRLKTDDGLSSLKLALLGIGFSALVAYAITPSLLCC